MHALGELAPVRLLARGLLALLPAALMPAAPAQAQSGAPVVWVEKRVSLQGRVISSLPDVVNESKQDVAGATLADVRLALERALRAKGLFADSSTGAQVPGALQARTTLLSFKTGDAAGRWIGFGAGAARCSIRIQLLEAGSARAVADIVHTRVVDSGGFFTIGADNSIHRDLAEELAETVARVLQKGS